MERAFLPPERERMKWVLAVLLVLSYAHERNWAKSTVISQFFVRPRVELGKSAGPRGGEIPREVINNIQGSAMFDLIQKYLSAKKVCPHF